MSPGALLAVAIALAAVEVALLLTHRDLRREAADEWGER